MPGGNHFQPSEWVKLILILAMAEVLCRVAAPRELSWPDLYKSRGHRRYSDADGAGPAPNLGTALTYVPVAIMGIFLGGLQWRQGLLVVVLATLGVGAVFFTPRVHVLKSYQKKQRLTSFLSREADPPRVGVPS